MDDNAILHFSALPRFAEIRPEDADDAVDFVLARLAQSADAAARARPEWDAMWTPLEEAQEAAAKVWNQIEHLHSVMSAPPWRKAHGRNLPKVAAAFARLGQHEGVYKNLRALAKNADSFSPVRQKILRDALRDFQLSGAALADAPKKEFRQNSERLSALAAKFEENLLDATNAESVSAKENDLGEMPADIKNVARAKDGFCFSLLPPSYSAFMQYASARDLRKKMYRLYHTRASEYGPAAQDNSQLIGEICTLRNRQAALLGFDDYAELAMQTRMAKSAAAVSEFLRDLAARAIPHARREMVELREFAAAELQIKELRPWDVSFAADRLRKKKFNFSAAELRPYLQADKVLDGLLSCIRQLFGAVLQEEDAQKWTEEARYFSVRDAKGGRIGGLYLDLFARETKRGGAWMAEAISRCRRNGELQHPAAHIVCNFTPPKNGAPALMNWDEAQTLFHEFGHALHHLLTEAEEYSASGMNGVEWDAVELPSQFLENFIWDWRVLSPMTSHAESGAPMPQDLFLRARAGRRFHAGLRLLRQIEFALFDLSLHSSSPRPFMEVLREVRRETALLSAPQWDRFPCGFSHIFAGGYAAGYYSYLWAETLSADMFAMFEESGDVLNSDLGEKFRREVLAAGGGRDAMESFVAARGRAPDSNALLKHYGLA